MQIQNILPSAILIVVLASAAAPGQVLINECYLGATDWFEILNASPAPVNLSGYQVLFSGDSATGPVAASFTFGAVTLGSGQVLVVTESAQLNTPAVPPGVQRIYSGVNIWWSGFASGFGGTCTLTDGAIGIDTVHWGNPANTNPVPPATFSPSITSLVGDYVYRLNSSNPSSPVDWASAGTGTPGSLNPGQQVGPLPISLDLSTPAPGALDMAVTTSPPVPGGEIYNLISLTDTVPDGSGPLFGVAMDAFPLIFTAVAPTSPFHTLLDGNGAWALGFPAGVPAGLHIEAVSILVQGISITRVSPVAVLDT